MWLILNLEFVEMFELRINKYRNGAKIYIFQCKQIFEMVKLKTI